ncbi:MAG: hypothetical protein HRU51_01850, partial [Xanthomonadales bacterium]|nr:hypothetical protein [Xanthomonadales bacterium]
NRGGFALYRLTAETPPTSDWVRQDGRNCTNGVIQYATETDGSRDDDPQVFFGRSVSITQVGPDDYRVVVGAPGYDGGAGKVYVYSYSGNTLSLLATAAGSGSDALGSAVTISSGFTDGTVRVLAGAPGANGGAGEGRVYGVGATLTLEQTLTQVGSTGLGTEVSITERQLLLSATNAAYIWSGNPDLPIGSRYSFAQNFAGSGGGDVSQSAGIAAFGANAPTGSGAAVFKNPQTDDLADAEFVNAADDLGNTGSLLGIDIRKTREYLWFADPDGGPSGEGQAIVYAFPAGQGGFNDTPFLYRQRSLPCDVEGLRLDDVFSSLGTSFATDNVNGKYDVFLYDSTKAATNATPYKQLADDYVFGPEDSNYSIWIATDEARYTPISTCNNFTTPDNYDAASSPTNLPQNGGTPFSTVVRAQSYITLRAAAIDPKGGPDFARQMVNTPFPRDFTLADLRYVDASGTIKTLEQAEAANELSATVYIYDPTGSGSTAQGYRPVTPARTPPFDDTIRGYEGFWVVIKEDGVAGSNDQQHALLVPQPE